jgi:carbapenam-3-carboxylate synthase
MINSFLATTSDKDKKNRLRSINIKNPESLLVEDDQWCFLFKGSNQIEDCSFRYGRLSVYLIGCLSNISEIRQIATIYDSDALSLNVAGLAYIIYNNLGVGGLSLLEGSYTILIKDFNGELKIITDPLGLMSVNLLRSNTPWISSEIKNFYAILPENFDFKTRDEISVEAYQDNYSPIKNIYRMKPGEIVTLHQDGMKNYHFESKVNHFFKLNDNQIISKTEANRLIDVILTSSIKNCLQENEEVTIPLSGGLDSSLVSSIASSQCKKVNTISIGTETHNEFYYADLVARHVKSNHKEIILKEDDIIKGIIDAIYHNEIFDGLSAEIQSPLFSMYKNGKIKPNSTVMTGYGADLIFGGVVPTDCLKENINSFLWHQISHSLDRRVL